MFARGLAQAGSPYTFLEFPDFPAVDLWLYIWLDQWLDRARLSLRSGLQVRRWIRSRSAPNGGLPSSGHGVGKYLVVGLVELEGDSLLRANLIWHVLVSR